MPHVAPLLKALVIAAMCLAAVIDVRTRRIPDSLVFFAFLAGTGCSIVERGTFGLLSLVTATAVLAALLACVHRNLIGGGDAKLIAAASAGFPPAMLPLLAFSIAVAGGIVAVFMVISRKWLVADEGEAGDIYQTVPYGVAIAVGTFATSFEFIRILD